MAKLKFVDNHIELETVTKRLKKMTGTRFATVMGLNVWSTPFEMWCAITKTYEKPFEDTIYTVAGKVIEPKVVEYLKDVYFMDIKDPEDVYGKDYFKKTWGDFYPEWVEFGGMWDAIGDDFIVEIKTTKRAEDWQVDIPIYYKLQAALYAYLSGFDDVYVTVSFLEPNDYDSPEKYVPSVENTKVFEFKMSDDFPNFEEDYIQPALAFWNNHVLTGISPDFDEKKDAEILKALRTNYVAPTDDDIGAILKEANELMVELNGFDLMLDPKRKQLKALESKIKDYMIEQFDDKDDRVELTTNNFIWSTSKSIRKSLDAKALEKEHPNIYNEYLKESETITLRKKEVDNG